MNFVSVLFILFLVLIAPPFVVAVIQFMWEMWETFIIDPIQKLIKKL